MGTRSPAELEFARNRTFFYEVWMLGETLERLTQTQTDQVVIKAKDYFNGTYNALHVSNASVPDPLLKKLHAQIVHMGGSRYQAVKIDPTDRLDLYNTLHDEVEHFRSLFPATDRPDVPAKKLFVAVGAQPAATNEPSSVRGGATKPKHK